MTRETKTIIHFHNVYGNQTCQGSDLPWQIFILKVAWPLCLVLLWEHVANLVSLISLLPQYLWTPKFFLIGIHSMQGWAATTRYGVTRRRTKILKQTRKLLQKEPIVKRCLLIVELKSCRWKFSTIWKTRLPQAHSSLEPPLEYNQDQMHLMNQGSLQSF